MLVSNFSLLLRRLHGLKLRFDGVNTPAVEAFAGGPQPIKSLLL
jgi:hypothetical protein